MSWDALLSCEACGMSAGRDWNFTHNTSSMIYAVLADAGYELPASTRPVRRYDRDTGQWTDHPNGYGTVAWWEHLDGMTGEESRPYLDTIIQGLEADPTRFREMNPPNGWGDYDSLLRVLHEMRAAAGVGHATKWGASG